MKNTLNYESPNSFFEKIIENLAGYVYWKDINSTYLGCNEKFAQLAGLKNKEEIKGLSDFDIHWHRQASLFQSEDKRSIEEGYLSNILTTMIINQTPVKQLVNKSRFLDSNNKILGMIGHATEVKIKKIHEDNICFIDTYDINNKVCICFMNGAWIYLTKKEYKCLIYILLGDSSSQIAERLHISRRTVETHVENIKNKFGCNTKSQLIKKAFFSGVLTNFFQDSSMSGSK